MTFRELLELYKKGELDESTAAEVKAELERGSAIIDYLSEQDEGSFSDFLEKETNGDFSSDQKQERQAEDSFRMELNKGIRRAFLKSGTVIGIALLAVILLFQFVMPHIVDFFYYNPTDIAARYKSDEYIRETQRMDLDMAVYSELFLPNALRDTVNVIRNGYGNYDIVIKQTVSRSNSFRDVGGKIDKGRLILYDNNVLKRPAGNVFEWAGGYDVNKSLGSQVPQPRLISDGGVESFSVSMAGYPDEAREKLKKLEDKKLYRAYVSLDRVLDYKALNEFLKKYQLSSVWCAVLLEAGGGYISNINIGFNDFFSEKGLAWDNQRYRTLRLFDLDTEEPVYNIDEDTAREHLSSLIRYYSEQQQFQDMMNEVKIDKNTAERMIAYLNENGVRVYGVSIAADKETLLELSDCEEVYSISTEELRQIAQ